MWRFCGSLIPDCMEHQCNLLLPSSHFPFINFDNFFALTIFILFISGMTDTMIFLFRQRKTIRWSRTRIICTNVVCIIYSIMSTYRIKPSWMCFRAEFRTWWTFVFREVDGLTLPSFLIPFCISFISTTNLNWLHPKKLTLEITDSRTVLKSRLFTA